MESLIQLHWFKVQVRKARAIVGKNVCNEVLLLDRFTSCATLIRAHRTVNQQELICPSNIVT